MRRGGKSILPLPGNTETAVATSFKQGTVKLVGTAARDHDGAGRTIQFGAGTIGFHSEFLHRVEARGAGLNAARVSVIKRHAVLVKLHSGIAQTVDAGLGRATFKARHRDGEQSLDGASVERQLFNSRPFHGSG